MKRITAITVAIAFLWIVALPASAIDLAIGGSWLDAQRAPLDQSFGGFLQGRFDLGIGYGLMGTAGVGYRSLDVSRDVSKSGRCFWRKTTVVDGRIDDLPFSAGVLYPIEVGKGLVVTVGGEAAYHVLRSDVSATDHYWFGSTSTRVEFDNTWTAGPVANLEWQLTNGIKAFAGVGYAWDLAPQRGFNLDGVTASAGLIYKVQ
jgi:hypothetical protein